MPLPSGRFHSSRISVAPVVVAVKTGAFGARALNSAIICPRHPSGSKSPVPSAVYGADSVVVGSSTGSIHVRVGGSCRRGRLNSGCVTPVSDVGVVVGSVNVVVVDPLDLKVVAGDRESTFIRNLQSM